MPRGEVGRALRVLVTVRNRFGTATATSARTRTVATPVELAAVRQSGGDWVLLRNRVGARVSLAGWSLRDAAGNVHALGKVTIAPGRFLRVPTPGLWDARDRATLRLPGGRVADTCSFAAKSDVVRC